jgi:hypothetical protein
VVVVVEVLLQVVGFQHLVALAVQLMLQQIRLACLIQSPAELECLLQMASALLQPGVLALVVVVVFSVLAETLDLEEMVVGLAVVVAEAELLIMGSTQAPAEMARTATRSSSPTSKLYALHRPKRTDLDAI